MEDEQKQNAKSASDKQNQSGKQNLLQILSIKL